MVASSEHASHLHATERLNLPWKNLRWVVLLPVRVAEASVAVGAERKGAA